MKLVILGSSVSEQALNHATKKVIGYAEVLCREYMTDLRLSDIRQITCPGNPASVSIVSFFGTKGQPCTNFQFGPLRRGCSSVLLARPTIRRSDRPQIRSSEITRLSLPDAQRLKHA